MKKTVFFLALLFLRIPIFSAPGFYVDGYKLMDANDNQFIIRGVNNPHIWWDSQSFTALDAIAWNSFNSVRIVWEKGGSASRLDEIISRCIELEMIPMPELHDGTGSNNVDDLLDMANYWIQNDVKAVIEKYKKHLLLNIANEWGDNNQSEEDWKEAYKQAITLIRNAGIDVTLVIDATKWGQGVNCHKSYGQELLDHDPQHNLLLDIHMYGSWNDSNKIEDELYNLRQLNLPILIGEFGYNYQNGNNNLGCEVDHTKVLEQCTIREYGYMPWSWCGNNQENAWLDLSSDWNDLNWWGSEIVNDQYGIKNTSEKCSVFGSEIKVKDEIIINNFDNFVYNGSYYALHIYNLSGRRVKSFKKNENFNKYYNLTLKPGVYFIKVIDQREYCKKKYRVIKFVKTYTLN